MKVPTILIVGAVFAVVASASQAAVFADGGGQPAQTMSQPQRAVMLRSEALNRKYHLGAYAAPRLDPAMRAVVLRSEALNRQYHLGAAATSTNAGSGSGFAWDIAAVGGVLLLLLVGATTLVRRPRASVKTSG